MAAAGEHHHRLNCFQRPVMVTVADVNWAPVVAVWEAELEEESDPGSIIEKMKISKENIIVVLYIFVDQCLINILLIHNGAHHAISHVALAIRIAQYADVLHLADSRHGDIELTMRKTVAPAAKVKSDAVKCLTYNVIEVFKM